jgi:hypothetical protein
VNHGAAGFRGLFLARAGEREPERAEKDQAFHGLQSSKACAPLTRAIPAW